MEFSSQKVNSPTGRRVREEVVVLVIGEEASVVALEKKFSSGVSTLASKVGEGAMVVENMGDDEGVEAME
ncbi:hypothetical protein GYH30_014197 [Glycine max]|nr:hypothetical protein GYH30_014197 [Glycine max]